jgi:hypothetical protein|tara:strand:- start:488 stop:958 length:471 start_codon:yes stop_codon:yes gene_type:complete
MGVAEAVILLLHPLLSLVVIYWMYKQYSHRKNRRELRGQQAKDSRESHERVGETLFRSALAVIAIGFFVNFSVGWIGGEGYLSVIPSALHGWFGVVGIAVLTITVRKGRLVKKQRESGQKFALELQRHGRASDVMMVLIVLHAFLGFVYLFQLLVK